MQCGKKEVLGLRIQAIDAMDSFVQPSYNLVSEKEVAVCLYKELA